MEFLKLDTLFRNKIFPLLNLLGLFDGVQTVHAIHTSPAQLLNTSRSFFIIFVPVFLIVKGFIPIMMLAAGSAIVPVRSQDPVYYWIEQGDTASISAFLEDHDINDPLADSGKTILILSILQGDVSTCNWLIEKGADVNLFAGGMSPLMYAASTDDVKKLNLLIEAKADIEAQDSSGNTVLFYAARNDNLRITKKIVKSGADLSHKNRFWQSAYDEAINYHNQEVAKYIRVRYEKNLPDFRDGPYVKWHGRKKIKAFYMVHDSKTQITRRSRKTFKTGSDPFRMNGFAGDTLDYLIHRRKEIAPDQVENAARVLVLGDIHGGYDSLVGFLQQNGVMDQSFRWSWGNGQLVFIGDIFDRGDKVTEALWLIYRLEDQAVNAGGAVHLILGNHEIMELTGNTSYLPDKYMLLSSKLNIDYPMLYGKRTVLGQWLRTKNTLVRINGYLFVHAGISPDLIYSGLDIGDINGLVRYYLNHPGRIYADDTSYRLIMGENGPFWYRGFIKDNHDYQHLPKKPFQEILTYFKVNSIFIGHTNVKKITALYDKQVFALDVPFYNYGYPIQGLMLEGKAVWLLNSSGDRRRIR